MWEALLDRFREEPDLAVLLALFAALVVVTVGGVWLLVLRPARRSIATVRTYRASLARDLLKTVPVSEMTFLEGSVRDLVSELTRKEGELQELYRAASERAEAAEQRMTQVLGSLGAGIVAVDRRGRIAAANAEADGLLSAAGIPLVGRDAEDAFRSTPSLAARALVASRGAAAAPERLVLRDPSGRERALAVSVSPWRDAAGRPAGGTLLLVDETEIREREARVALKERLAGIGELSAGLAHELRNPLATIAGYAKVIAKAAAGRADLETPAQTIVAEANAVERLVRDFLEYARPVALDAAETDLREIARGAAADAKEQAARARVRLVLDASPAAVPVRADAERLRQALGNLLRNAIEASRARGEVRVAVATDGGEATLSVEDGGAGIPAGSEEKLFTPFFSTKRAGVGMGLALAQKTAAAHGGRIVAANRDGGGARFVLHVPLSRTPAPDSGGAARQSGRRPTATRGRPARSGRTSASRQPRRRSSA